MLPQQEKTQGGSHRSAKLILMLTDWTVHFPINSLVSSSSGHQHENGL